MTRKSTNPCLCPRAKKQARQHWKAAQQKCQFCQEYDELKHHPDGGYDDGYDYGYSSAYKGEHKAHTTLSKK